jgi:hypothetical protein
MRRIQSGPRTCRTSALGALALCVALAGCSGSDSDDDGGTTTPNTPQTFTQTLPPLTFTGLPNGAITSADISITGTGTMTSTVNWTFAQNDVDIYVTSTACAATNNINIQTGCTAIGRTTSVVAKPETLTVNVTSGNYRIWVVNFGPGAESGTLSVSATGTR